MRKAFAVAVMALTALPALAQLKLPRASQHQVVTQTVGLTNITIDYSRPGVKGRKIWGELVPYGAVWRTGANEATTISFSDEVTVNGQKLAAGTYSLHTIPNPNEWTIIFNKVDKQWGSFSYDQSKDALRIAAKPEKGDFHEWLTFDFADLTTDSANVVLRWENLAVPFMVGTSGTEKAMANVKAALASAKPDDWQIAYRGASFAFDNGDMTDAKAWLDQSLKAKETISNLFLKARLQAHNGDVAGAKKTAEAAIALAGPGDKDFVTEIKRVSGSWK